MPPRFHLPVGVFQCDHRCPSSSHLAWAQPLLLVSLSTGETCWNLQSIPKHYQGTVGQCKQRGKERRSCELTESVGQQGWPKFSQTSWLQASQSWQCALSSPLLRPHCPQIWAPFPEASLSPRKPYCHSPGLSEQYFPIQVLRWLIPGFCESFPKD